MRVLDRIISFLFSVIILIVSIVLILVGTKVIESQMIIDILGEKVFSETVISKGFFNPLTIAGIVLLLAALKTTIFLSLFKIRNKAPITVKTKNGEVQIAQETIINTARTATLTFDNVKDVQAKMVKKGKGVIVYEIIQAYVNSNLKELTLAIQEEVKQKVTSTTGVIVHDVNIKVKNVVNDKKRASTDHKVEAPVNVQQNEQKEEVFNVDEAVKKAEELENESKVANQEQPIENDVKEAAAGDENVTQNQE